MKVYVFTDEEPPPKKYYRQDMICSVLEKVGGTTDTSNLVVAVYLLSDKYIWGGHTIGHELDMTEFHHGTGRKWAFVRSFKTPDDLPKRFKLIRLFFGMSMDYPRTERDNYGWKARFGSFKVHLADLFAHELHHFRRHHLGLHPGEGEQSACKWALKRVREIGYHLKAVRIKRQKLGTTSGKKLRAPLKRNVQLVRRIKLIASHLSHDDLEDLGNWAYKRSKALQKQHEQECLKKRFDELRALPEGSKVRIMLSPSSGQYENQIATKALTFRLGPKSLRLAIQTSDGKHWYWPMEWLEPVGQSGIRKSG